MQKIASKLILVIMFSTLMGVSKCSSPEMERSGTPPIDESLEKSRRESSTSFPTPRIKRIFRKGTLIWQEGEAAPQITAGETLVLEGSGFGLGTEIDYSKILVGKSRAIESDLQMFVGHVDVKKANYFEVNELYDSWKKEIISWSNNRIEFKVPETSNRGPLVVSVQKRISSNPSLSNPEQDHSVWDPNSERIHGSY